MWNSTEAAKVMEMAWPNSWRSAIRVSDDPKESGGRTYQHTLPLPFASIQPVLQFLRAIRFACSDVGVPRTYPASPPTLEDECTRAYPDDRSYGVLCESLHDIALRLPFRIRVPWQERR